MHGLRVGVTAARKGSELVEILRRRGAQVVHGPTLGGDEPADAARVVEDTERILAARPAWFAASTGVGMRLWAEVADRHGRLTALRETLGAARCVARGAKAVSGLRTLGLRPVFTAPRETDADVAGWLAGRVLPGETIGLQLHGGASHAFAVLDGLPVTVHTVAPYVCALPSDPEPARTLIRRLVDGQLDLVTFTSPGAVRNLVRLAEEAGAWEGVLARLRSSVATAAVGPVTAEALEAVGALVAVMPARSRTGDLVRAIDAWATRRADGLAPPVKALQLVPARSAVAVCDHEIPLGDREYAVLAALLRRPGVVCRPAQLMAEAWGHEAPRDPSTVKHQIARLRRKLGDEAGSIQTVRGVGYRFVPAQPAA